MVFVFCCIRQISTISAKDRYAVEQRVHIIETYFENRPSVIATDSRIRPSERTNRSIVRQFESTGSVQDINRQVRERSAR